MKRWVIAKRPTPICPYDDDESLIAQLADGKIAIDEMDMYNTDTSM